MIIKNETYQEEMKILGIYTPCPEKEATVL